MKAQAPGTMQRASRTRIAVALCVAGLVAGTLSSSLVGAGAENAPPVPGESVAAPPTQIASTTPQTSTTETTPSAPADPAAEAAAAQAAAQAAASEADTAPSASEPAPPDPAATALATPGTPPAAAGPAAPAAPAAPTAPTAPAAPAAPAAPQQPAPTATLEPTADPQPLGDLAGAPQAPAARTCTSTRTRTASPAARTANPAARTANPAARTANPAARTANPAARTASPAVRAAGRSRLVAGAKVALTSAKPATRIRAAAACKAPAAKNTAGRAKTSTSRKSSGTRDGATGKVLRNDQGVPTLSNPSTSLAIPGAAAIGVPNFFIDKFRIPVFLLPIYQAAGIQYGVRWEVLAAINEIETDYGRNLNVSSAGALGWMQFMPATWKSYGVDANRDGRKDPFNPVDAIFAAARYLKAAGADDDLRKAIFAYNHADWYVESVLMRARLIGGLPSDLVGSLSGLTQGHFPVFAKARYADDITERGATRRAKIGTNVAMPVEADATRRGIDIYAAAGSPAIAVQDGRIVSVGTSKRLGRYVKMRDVYGNTYTYSQLKKVATRIPVPKDRTQSKASIAKELALPKADPKPTRAASAGRPTRNRPSLSPPAPPSAAKPKAAAISKERLFAHPSRPNPLKHGGARQVLELESTLAAGESLKSYFTLDLDEKDVVLRPLVAGSRVIAGTVLGRIGTLSERVAPHVHFEIRPAGRGAPQIDPKPILDGWKLLEATAIYRAKGRNPLADAGALNASIGQILLMSKETLARRVLSNPRIDVYSCGRRDIEAGGVDRRVLATLEFLAASGLRPTVTSLYCGHGYYTASGNVSAHSSGNAVDIAMINGIPILGNQGEGSITDITIRRLLTLQGTMKPSQIISLMTYADRDNTLALGDHDDHIHVGYGPGYAAGTPAAKELEAILKPSQWIKLIDRLGHIDNPSVAKTPSKYAIAVPVPRASSAHTGE